MNTDKKILYSFVYSLLGLLIVALFIPNDISNYIIAAILVTYTILVCYFVKKRSILSIHKKQVLYLLVVISLVYLMIYYLSGIKFGFYISNYTFSLMVFLKYILPLTVIIVCSEIIRSVLLAQSNKIADIVAFICFNTLEFLMVYDIYSFTNFSKFINITCLTILPAIIFNVLCHDLSRTYGSYPNIAFRLITTLYIYIIPYIPNTPESLVSLFKLLIPLIILWFIRILYQKRKSIATKRSSRVGYAMFTITAAIMIFIVMVISNQFKFGLIVIATDSMKGEIASGDVIVYEKLDTDDSISIGQIIVFKKDEALIVHRVVDIEYIDGVIQYYTKGDANDKNDEGFITRTEIVGYIHFSIPAIGYPTLWLRELFD